MSDGVKPCEKCHNLTEDIVCSICNSTGRDSQTICVVEDIRDLLAIETWGYTKEFTTFWEESLALWMVLQPSICSYKAWSIEAKSSEKTEVIFALPATMEGETTSFYLYKNFRISMLKLRRLQGELQLVNLCNTTKQLFQDLLKTELFTAQDNEVERYHS